MATSKPSPSNVLADPSQSLQTFNLLDLQQYKKEKFYATSASKDFHLFYVGRDDVHNILKHVLSRVSISLYLNMFGFDDDELNDILMAKVLDPHVVMLITLDKSQAGGKHERALLDSDAGKDPIGFSTHFVVGQSETHQISHTKGFIADGRVGGEGSTNWSRSGEGTFLLSGQPGGPGYKAQNNTQTIFTDQDTISRFQAELISEHMTAQEQASQVKTAQVKAAQAQVVQAQAQVAQAQAAAPQVAHTQVAQAHAAAAGQHGAVKKP
jgi:hypothetical protein